MSETCSESLFTNENIEDILPLKWKHKLLSKIKFGNPFMIEYSLKVALFSQEDVEEWVDDLQKRTQCNYSIVHTRKVAGEKLKFKRYFYCQHRTRSKDTYPSKGGTKNTNCPSKLIISLYRVGNNKYQNKGKPPLDPKMPCVIDYVVTHNHSVQLAQKFRKVPTDVNNILLDLFAKGHSASTAYEIIRIGARINNPDNYEEILDNRSVCPDRNYCNKWFNDFKKQRGEVDKTDITFMSSRLEEYNSEVGDECAKLEWKDKDNYAVALCSPLLKRVHKHIKSSSEVVFMAAINPAGNEGRKAFFLTSPSECGALPIGIVITSSETAGLIELGLKLLKNLVGETMFFGAKIGPKVFVVDDCEAGQIALNAVWPKSSILFCGLHVIHTLWRYLLCSKNGINREDHIKLFDQFRKIMYADTEEECINCYTEARISAENYPNYLQILKAYWEKRRSWGACYRRKLLGNFEENSLEESMCILREPIFHRMRSFDVIQLTDFLLTKFDDFFALRLLDGANRRTIRDLTKKLPLPKNIHVEQINGYLFLVPSLKLSHVKYHVNVEIVACTCLKYTTGYICNHIGWILTLFSTPQEKVNDLHVRETFYKVATGQDPIEDNFQFTDEDFEEDNGDTKTQDNLVKYEILEEDNEEYNLEDEIQDTSMETENVDMSQSENSESKIIKESLIIAGNEVIRLQIVKEEAEFRPKVSAVSNVLPGIVVRSITTDHVAFEIGQKLNTQLFNRFESFLKESPMTVAPILQQMINKTKRLTCLEDFLSACKTFSEG